MPQNLKDFYQGDNNEQTVIFAFISNKIESPEIGEGKLKSEINKRGVSYKNQLSDRLIQVVVLKKPIMIGRQTFFVRKWLKIHSHMRCIIIVKSSSNFQLISIRKRPKLILGIDYAIFRKFNADQNY